uniref:Uncharacterized protein LOC104235813 n=1 Tax=Nicotiana sylvestris TaxID=4096 RepID=A0A1U7XAP9_NICSY|nr:PREDICTED: uncharacterized protein LOC104235813 [Nicotiana sylvestris]
MKLNPEKCAFGAGSGKFLGFMVSNRGVEINPDKIKSIEEITVVNNVKAIQRLTRRIMALDRFISSSSDCNHHFFSLHKKKNNFAWTPKCQRALEELKRYLSSPPLLHTSKEDEMLYLYLSVSEVARYLDKLQIILHHFNEWTLDHVPREQNDEGNTLANLGSSVEEDDIVPGAVIQWSKSVIEEGHAEINSTSLTWDWGNKYIDYLKHGKHPADPKESRTLLTKVARFLLDENGTLYKRTFDGRMAVCLGPRDTDYILRKILEGSCGNHSSTDSLIHKVIRVGYYWDIMEKIPSNFFESVISARDLHQQFSTPVNNFTRSYPHGHL